MTSPNSFTPPQETQHTPEQTLENAEVIFEVFGLPNPMSDLEGYEKKKKELKERCQLIDSVGKQKNDVRIDNYAIEDNFSDKEIDAIKWFAQVSRMHNFETGEDFETPLAGEYDFTIVPAGRNGSANRLEQVVLKAIDDGTATVNGPIVLAGSMERKFAPQKDGKDNPELVYFRKTYPDAFRRLMNDNGADYIPSEYDLVQAQAEHYTTTLDREVVAVGAAKTEERDYVDTYAVASVALDRVRDRMIGTNSTESEELFKGSRAAFATNEIYNASNGPHMQLAAEQHGISLDRVTVAGCAAPGKPERNLTAYLNESLKAIDTASEYVSRKDSQAV